MILQYLCFVLSVTLIKKALHNYAKITWLTKEIPLILLYAVRNLTKMFYTGYVINATLLK